MANPLSDSVGTFTPIVDDIAKELGLVTAAVYGAVWRFCQMEDRVCRASLEKLAEVLGVDRATVMRHIKVLCEKEYLIDLTPGLRNVPHTYKDNRKTVALCNSLPQKTVAQNNSSDKTVAECNATVAESHLKRLYKETPKESATPKNETVRQAVVSNGKTPPPVIPAFKIYVEVTEYYSVSKHWRFEMGKVVGDKPDDLDFWRRVVIGWTGKYATKHNVQGMLDYYKRHEIPGEQLQPLPKPPERQEKFVVTDLRTGKKSTLERDSL